MINVLGNANIGNTVAMAGVGGAVLSAFMGTSFSFLAKIFIIIEFMTQIQMFNVNYEPILDGFFTTLGKYTEINIMSLSLPSEKKLQAQNENSLPGKWKGKLSIHEVAPWLL